MITIQFTGRNAKPNPVHIGVEGRPPSREHRVWIADNYGWANRILACDKQIRASDIITLVDNTLDVISPKLTSPATLRVY